MPSEPPESCPSPASTLCEAYAGCWKLLSKYWEHYGGWKAFFCSPYLHISLLLGFIGSTINLRFEWWETCLSVVPSMLGFSLGGYAILMAIGAGSFQDILARAGGRDESVLGKISAAFMHFILVQSAVLVLSIFVALSHAPFIAWWQTATESPTPTAQLAFGFVKHCVATLGYTAAIYPIMCGVGATFWIFIQVEWFVEYVHRVKAKEKEASGSH